MEKKRILCLDLDGTIRRSKSGKTFIEGPDDIEIIPGMKEAIWRYYNDGWMIIGITNQGGVAHGFKTVLQVIDETKATGALLSNDGVCPLTKVWHCPEDVKGTVEPYNWRSLHRKPSIGMLAIAEQWMVDHGIIPDWDNSLFVGDRPEDEECAKSARIPFIWAHDFVK